MLGRTNSTAKMSVQMLGVESYTSDRGGPTYGARMGAEGLGRGPRTVALGEELKV